MSTLLSFVFNKILQHLRYRTLTPHTPPWQPSGLFCFEVCRPSQNWPSWLSPCHSDLVISSKENGQCLQPPPISHCRECVKMGEFSHLNKSFVWLMASWVLAVSSQHLGIIFTALPHWKIQFMPWYGCLKAKQFQWAWWTPVILVRYS